MAPKYSMFNFYSFPVSLGQSYFVLVLISTNHNARNRYPEIIMARTAYKLLLNLHSALLGRWNKNSKYFFISLSVLRCPVLLPPSNGRLVSDVCGNMYGSTCHMQCNRGYELKGSVRRTCEKKPGRDRVYWTGDETFCQGKE